jgi:PadR family transcriptional regulator, regulatory protein PadR
MPMRSIARTPSIFTNTHMRDLLAVASPSSRRVDEVIRGPIKSKTIFPVLLLHLIREHPDHGYGLMQRIESVCGDLIAVNTNKIYPLLRRLEERGFVTATWDHPTKRSRRIYAITSAGEERLGKIKGAMLPYLDSIERAVARLKKRLYQSPTAHAVSSARSSA